eukprot:4628407-Prymnesium_polylepis.2
MASTTRSSAAGVSTSVKLHASTPPPSGAPFACTARQRKSARPKSSELAVEFRRPSDVVKGLLAQLATIETANGEWREARLTHRPSAVGA